MESRRFMKLSAHRHVAADVPQLEREIADASNQMNLRRARAEIDAQYDACVAHRKRLLDMHARLVGGRELPRATIAPLCAVVDAATRHLLPGDVCALVVAHLVRPLPWLVPSPAQANAFRRLLHTACNALRAGGAISSRLVGEDV